MSLKIDSVCKAREGMQALCFSDGHMCYIDYLNGRIEYKSCGCVGQCAHLIFARSHLRFIVASQQPDTEDEQARKKPSSR